VRLRLDWESAEELVGAILRRARRHDSTRRVRARLEPDLPLVRCDALLLAQMLDNLVDNALKYSRPPAPVELLVRRQAGHVVFAVRDRGAGVPAKWREKIFDAFERGVVPQNSPHDSRDDAPAQRGAGVGLTVCRAIARAHGGELRLRSRSHGGSSFEFWLPEAVAPADVDPAARRESVP
jgi:two-component system sensor histidine kinase KdpD